MRLRTPNFPCAFLIWLRTVSSPRPARGRMENLIKDLKLYTRSDKTACHRWQANQFRLFLHQGAYWLLHLVRMAAPKRSRWRVEELRTRIKLSFSAHLPHADVLEMIAARFCPQAPCPKRPQAPREPSSYNRQRVCKRPRSTPPSTRPMACGWWEMAKASSGATNRSG
jgi:Transposase DDE domain group 1